MKKLISFVFYMMVVSLMLTTVIGCSSVKKTKEVFKEEIAVKKNLDESLLSAKTSESEEKINSYQNTSSTQTINTIGIEYVPTFDISGALIPFHYNKTDSDGNKTKIDIVGPAKVTTSNESKTDNVLNVFAAENVRRTMELDSTIAKLDERIESNTNRIEVTKTKAPDYIKFIIWLGASITILAIIIVLIILYFKRQISNIKKLIP